MVRVDRRGADVARVPAERLQAKADRYYFREAIGLEPDARIRSRRFPAPPSFLELVRERFTGRGITAAATASTVRRLQPVFRILEAAGLDDRTEVAPALLAPGLAAPVR